MVIRKKYNIEQLVEQLQTEIENSKKYNRVVKLDILTANDILDVLNETNKMELHNKTVIGMKDAKCIAKMACDAAVLNGTQKNDRVRDCYGCYYDKGLYCYDCKSRESCVEETINRENVEEDDDFI